MLEGQGNPNTKQRRHKMIEIATLVHRLLGRIECARRPLKSQNAANETLHVLQWPSLAHSSRYRDGWGEARPGHTGT